MLRPLPFARITYTLLLQAYRPLQQITWLCCPTGEPPLHRKLYPVLVALGNLIAYKCHSYFQICTLVWHIIFGKVGRTAPEEVIIQLLKTKYLPVLYYGLEVCPVNRTRLGRWTTPSIAVLKEFSQRQISLSLSSVRYFGMSTCSGHNEREKKKFQHKFRMSPNQLCVIALFKDKTTAVLELQ